MKLTGARWWPTKVAMMAWSKGEGSIEEERERGERRKEREREEKRKMNLSGENFEFIVRQDFS